MAQHSPCVKASTSFTASSSTYGAAPRPSAANVELFAKGLALGVPGRDGGREPGLEPGREPDAGGGLVTRSSIRALGGAERGRVDKLSAGIDLPLTVGSTSSRLTGMPRDTSCFRRIRERVQLIG